MASLNKVQIIGRCGADPEVRALPSGGKVVNLRVACSEQWRDKQSGERRERTEWVRVVIFNERIASVAEQCLKKGSQCYIEGQLQTRKFTDQQGVEKFFTEVVLQNYRGELVLLDAKGSDTGESQDWQAPSEKQSISQRAAPKSRNLSEDLQDDVPF